MIVARNQQHDREHHQLLEAERPAFLLLDEDADEIVPRLGLARFDEPAEKHHELRQVGEELGRRRARPSEAHSLNDRIGPTLEVREPLRRNAEQLCDDRDRDGYREVRHEIHLTAIHDAGEALPGDLADARLELLHSLRGEPSVHEVAQPCVIRRIGADERSALHQGAEGGSDLVRPPPLDATGEEVLHGP